MPENRTEKTTARDQGTARILRQRRGGVADEVVERHREYNRVRKKVTEAVQSHPRTVPEIADLTALPTHQVLWHLMAMKKYGKVVEGEECGDYYQYALKPEQEKGT
jgi:predicted Rossmann fold nucleotide-binding protein DprA/Smf involved in DNA uptake